MIGGRERIKDFSRLRLLSRLVGLLALVLVVAALHATSWVSSTLALAFFITMAVWPVDAFCRDRLPAGLRWLGHVAALALVLVLFALFLAGMLLAAQQLAAKLPAYEGDVRILLEWVSSLIEMPHVVDEPGDALSGSLMEPFVGMASGGFCCKLSAYGRRGIGDRQFAGELFMFKGRHFDRSVILLCVRWYLAYGLSLRDLKEMMAERCISLDHSTIHRWVVHFSPLLLERFNRRKCAVTGKWHVDETYIKVRGKWMYLYRAIDSTGDTVEFWFSEHRDLPAAKRFFRNALERHGRPERVVIDGSQTNRKAIVSCDAENRLRDRSRRAPKRILIRQSRYLNNRIEQDHRRIKRRVRPMLGFKSFASATATLAGIEMIHMMRKRQARYVYNPNPSIAEQFEIIGAA